jgi:transposase
MNYNNNPQLRLDVVQDYLNNSKSLRNTAQKFHVNYQTVFKWIKLYKEHGKESLFSLTSSARRTNRALEEKVVSLKEENPFLTVRKAKNILDQQGLNLSIRGIWGIWKRYGYTGFKKKNTSSNYLGNALWTNEAKNKYEFAKKNFSLGRIEETAKILNSIPVLPQNTLIEKIPDHYLILKRRVEKITSLFGKGALSAYLRKVKQLSLECQKNHLCYSALRAGLMEITALDWTAQPSAQLKRIKQFKKLRKKKQNSKNPHIFEAYLTILIFEGIAYASLLKIKEARHRATVCKRLLKKRKHPSPYLMLLIGNLFSKLEDYKEAEHWLLNAHSGLDKDTKKLVNVYLANVFFSAGEYKKSTHFSKGADLGERFTPLWKLLTQLLLAMVNGMPHNAIFIGTEILSGLKKEELTRGMFSVYLAIASAYASLGDKSKARKTILKIMPFLIKKNLKREVSILEILFSQKPKYKLKAYVNKDTLPAVKLAFYAKSEDYYKALTYAKKKGILSNFYIYIFFFPEMIKTFLERGKSTQLPKKILRLPVFNRTYPVYDISFLGDTVIYKSQRYLKIKLPPKHASFLIHLSLRAGEPAKRILLYDIYDNFWKTSPHQSKNLSHLLTRIRKTLQIPPHLLEIDSQRRNPVLTNKGIYFMTDYARLEQLLASANALHKVGEWKLAKSEFLGAFNLIKGEPFRKMYDNWSEHMRRVILSKIEREAAQFSKICLKHNDKKSADRILEKLKKFKKT